MTRNVASFMSTGKLIAKWRVGVARRIINPGAGVELAGLGYYLNRAWQRVRDGLTATALVISDEQDHSLRWWRWT